MQGTSSRPRVSIFMMVLNGMPFLPAAVESLKAQTYRDFEFVIQDGGSTDGTLEYLQALDGIPACSIRSEPDSGVSQAMNRAIARCSGSIVGSIDADNLFEPDALERAVEFLDANPSTAVAYGGSNMVMADGSLLYPWMPGEFDLLALLEGELVPPFAVSFFVPAQLEEEFRFDESLATVPDFDFWLRASHLSIRRIDRILGSTRLSQASSTRRVESYEPFVRDKSIALERFLDRFEPNPVLEAVRRRSLAGIHLWAASSLLDIEGQDGEHYERFLVKAEELHPTSPRAATLRREASRPPARASEPAASGRPRLRARLGSAARVLRP